MILPQSSVSEALTGAFWGEALPLPAVLSSLFRVSHNFSCSASALVRGNHQRCEAQSLLSFNYLWDFKGSGGDDTFLNAPREEPASLFPLSYLPPCAGVFAQMGQRKPRNRSFGLKFLHLLLMSGRLRTER